MGEQGHHPAGQWDAQAVSDEDRDHAWNEIKAKVDRDYKAFDKKRKRLIAAYQRAETPRAQLLTLATCMRQHGEYVCRNILNSGWQTQAFAQFAEQIELIADDLEA